MAEKKSELLENQQTDWGQIINWIITIVLIIVVGLAVHQYAFLDKRCTGWAEDRIYNVRSGNPDLEYYCTMECNSTFGEKFVASTRQLNSSCDYPIKYDVGVFDNE